MIWRATAGDAHQVADVLREMHAEAPVGFPPYNEEKGMMAISRVIESGVVFVAGEFDGVLGLERQTYWFSDEAFIGDVFFFVRKGARKTRAGVKLLKAAAELSDTLGERVRLSVFNGLLGS